MLRKWEYIAERLEKEKASQELVAKAKEFDQFLKANYELLHTPPWVEDYKRFKERSLRGIISDNNYCVACWENADDFCDKCAFGRKYGRCLTDDSAYSAFIKMYYGELKK